MRRIFTYLVLIFLVLTVSSCGWFEEKIKLSIDDEVYDSSERTIIITTNDLQIEEIHVSDYVFDNKMQDWSRTGIHMMAPESAIVGEWYSVTLLPHSYEIEVKLQSNNTDVDRRLNIQADGHPGNGSATATITQKSKE